MRPVLKETGMQVVIGEVLDGHTWGCWRDMLGVALPWLFADSFRPREVPAHSSVRSPPATLPSTDPWGDTWLTYDE